MHNYYLYLDFIESSYIFPSRMESLLDSILGNYNKKIPAHVGDVQSQINLDVDLFWLGEMSPR